MESYEEDFRAVMTPNRKKTKEDFRFKRAGVKIIIAAKGFKIMKNLYLSKTLRKTADGGVGVHSPHLPSGYGFTSALRHNVSSLKQLFHKLAATVW